MVLFKRPCDVRKEVLAVVTNETKLKARGIIAIHEKRRHIEVLFEKLRESLGLGEYQMIARDATQRHLHSVCQAHLVMTHHSLDAAGAKAMWIPLSIRWITFCRRLVHSTERRCMRST